MKNTYIIAEAGVNHNGNLDLALKLVEEAKKATKLLGVKKKDLYILDYKVRQFDQSRQEILDDIIEFRNNYIK